MVERIAARLSSSSFSFGPMNPAIGMAVGPPSSLHEICTSLDF